MTISSATNKSGPYTENGVTDTFAYEFKIEDESHVKVVRATAGVETILTLTTDYTVTGVGDDAGGNVVVNTPVSGSTLTLVLNVPFTQELNLENQGAYYAENVEAALDLSVQRDKQLAEQLSRAVIVPVSTDPPEVEKLIGGVVALLDNVDDVVKVAAIDDEVVAVAGMADEVAAVAGVADALSIVASGGAWTFRGAWTSGRNYLVNDATEKGGSIWIAKRPNTGVTPAEGADWTLFLPGVSVADGAVTRPKLSDALSSAVAKSPKEFGAIGDGIADDTVALNAWAATGGVLVGDGKTYRVTDSVVFSVPFTLDGRGMEIEHFSALETPAIDVVRVDDCTIENVRINGRKDLKPASQSQAHGIRLTECRRFVIRNNRIRDTHEHGVSCYSINDTTPYFLEDAVISGNFFSGVGNKVTARGAAIWVFGYVRRIQMIGNIATDCIVGVAVDDASGSGPVRSASESVIVGNYIKAHTIGLYFESCSVGVINGNHFIQEFDGSFTPMGLEAAVSLRAIQMSVDPVYSLTLTNNNILGRIYGVFMGDVRSAVISGNLIVQSDKFSVGYGSSAGIRAGGSGTREHREIDITANTVYAEVTGIYVGSETGNERYINVKTNSVTNTGTGIGAAGSIGISSVQVNDVTIADNTVQGFEKGIYVKTIDPLSTGSRTFIKGNQTENATMYGIDIAGASRFWAIGNFTSASTTAGINIGSGVNNGASELSGNICPDTIVGGASVTKTYANRTT
jgi:hypothetical protein